jgi:hypothetical protein
MEEEKSPLCLHLAQAGGQGPGYTLQKRDGAGQAAGKSSEVLSSWGHGADDSGREWCCLCWIVIG